MMDFNINKLEISSFKFPEILLPSLLTVREIILVYLGQVKLVLVLNFCFIYLGKMSSVLARRRRNSYVWRPGNYLHENSRLLTFVHLQGNVRHRLQGT